MKHGRTFGHGLGLGWKKSMQAVLALLILFGIAAPRLSAQSASTWNRRGQQAETREDYDAAFEAYRQAHLKSPGDLRYRERYERLRYTAANLHVDRGRVLRQSGDVTGAINEFARALQIDPGNEAASQEMQVTEHVPAPGSGSGAPAAPAGGVSPGQTLNPGPAEQMPHQHEVQDEISTLAAPVQLQPVSNEPITLHMVEDTKVIYQAIGKLAGINVIFDPDYNSKRVPIDLTSVPLLDALRILGTLSQTFWKPVTPNTIFVAQNSRDKRTNLDDLATQTFYLTNVSQQNDANEIMVALRNLLDQNVKIYLVNSQNAIVLRATPDQLVLAEKIINDLDRTRSEVIVDVAVLEVSRDKLRNLGITLPTSFGLTPQTSNANTSSSTTSGTTTSGTTSGTSSTGASSTATSTTNLTLNSLGNLNATNFAVSVSGGTVNALLTDNDTRVLQNPRVRASDGQRAQLKIGNKIPVATGSYSSTLSTTASLGVQTQFTYIDTGVNIDMTPTVHFDREISLKLKVEISSATTNVTISGVTEPIISQRVAEQTIQLHDGEPSILAGLLQRQDTKTVNGTPGLGEIPFLKYLFSSQSKEQATDEIVFLIIPHIVRESLVTADNTRPIYTGTSNSVELIRRAGALGPAEPIAAQRPQQPTISAANAANSMMGVIGNADRPAQPPPAAPAPAVASSAPPNPNQPPVNLSVTPSSSTPAVGSTFQVSVVASGAQDLSEVPLQMHFDPRVLTLVNVDSGDLLGRDGQAVALVHRDEGNGTVTVSAARPPQTNGVTGSGVICTLTFKANAAGDSPLSLVKIGAKDSRGTTLPAVGTQGVVHVK